MKVCRRDYCTMIETTWLKYKLIRMEKWVSWFFLSVFELVLDFDGGFVPEPVLDCDVELVLGHVELVLAHVVELVLLELCLSSLSYFLVGMR